MAVEIRQLKPRVSVIIPLFNEEPDVLQRSLASLAAQTWRDFECLVVDESTKPETVAACEAFCQSDLRFRRLRPSSRIGLAASLNLGISTSIAPLLARFDSDDICVAERLSLQVGYLDSHPEVDVVGAGLRVIADDETIIAERHYPESHDQIARLMQLTTPIAHPTVMLRRTVIERHGAYDASFRNAEDLDLWLRLLNAGTRFANLPQVLVSYRQTQTRRPRRHWHYNLRARMRNFSSQLLPLRLLGISAVFIWSMLPAFVQETIFRRLILTRSRTRHDD